MRESTLITGWDANGYPYCAYILSIKEKLEDGSYLLDVVDTEGLHSTKFWEYVSEDVSSKSFVFQGKDKVLWDSIIKKIETKEYKLPYHVR